MKQLTLYATILDYKHTEHSGGHSIIVSVKYKLP